MEVIIKLKQKLTKTAQSDLIVNDATKSYTILQAQTHKRQEK